MAKGIILGQEPNIDDKLNNYLPLAGGTMNGQINMNNKKITGLPNATDNTDAVNLQQLIAGIPEGHIEDVHSFWLKQGSTKTISLSKNGTYLLETTLFVPHKNNASVSFLFKVPYSNGIVDKNLGTTGQYAEDFVYRRICNFKLVENTVEFSGVANENIVRIKLYNISFL